MAELKEGLAILIHAIIIGAIPILAKFIISFIQSLIEHKTAHTNNEKMQNFLNELSNTVTSAVAHTSQTYVNELKKTDKFDIEAQKRALQITKNSVISMLTENSKSMLANENLDKLIESKIEEIILNSKNLIESK